MDVDYTAYLQGSLVLDGDGCWWHEGVKFKNEKLALFFHQSIKFSPEENEFFVVIGRQRARFTYKDTALFVFTYDDINNLFILNNNSSVKVDDVNFSTAKNTHALYITFPYSNYTITAKISKSCYQSLVEYITSDNTFCFHGISKTIISAV